jgi:hypothetical protein
MSDLKVLLRNFQQGIEPEVYLSLMYFLMMAKKVHRQHPHKEKELIHRVAHDR